MLIHPVVSMYNKLSEEAKSEQSCCVAKGIVHVINWTNSLIPIGVRIQASREIGIDRVKPEHLKSVRKVTYRFLGLRQLHFS